MRVKRLLDISITILLILFVWPLLLIVAVLVCLDGGSAIYGHTRVGYRGRSFQCLKFRSMRRDADRVLAEVLLRDPVAQREWEMFRKLPNDPRITRVGRFIRATSIDELPQLLNVLRGDMSMVGPRPVVKEELTQHYGGAAMAYMSVRPGITGLWQVNGRSQTAYAERVALDLQYIRSLSLRADLAILWRTIGVVLKCDGAY